MVSQLLFSKKYAVLYPSKKGSKQLWSFPSLFTPGIIIKGVSSFFSGSCSSSSSSISSSSSPSLPVLSPPWVVSLIILIYVFFGRSSGFSTL